MLKSGDGEIIGCRSHIYLFQTANICGSKHGDPDPAVPAVDGVEDGRNMGQPSRVPSRDPERERKREIDREKEREREGGYVF